MSGTFPEQNLPQSPPPPYQVHDTLGANPSQQPLESSPLFPQEKGQGERVPPGPPPPYSNGGVGTAPSVRTQPRSSSQPQQRAQAARRGGSNYAPSQGGCCDLGDDTCCTLCMCCFCWLALCNE